MSDNGTVPTASPAPAIALAVTSAVLGATGWLGWVVSGARTRNSFETFRAAQRLGLDVLTPIRVVWFCTPVLAAAVCALLLFGQRRLAALLALPLAILVGGAGLAVILAEVTVGPGPFVASVAALVQLPLSVLLLIQGHGSGGR